MQKFKWCLAPFLFAASLAFGETQIGIEGAVEWDTLEIKAAVSLDLASAGIRLPAGRTQGEAIIGSEYLRLIRPGILDLQVDSSSTIADLIERGELSLLETENIALQARAVPPALSPDLCSISAAYTLSLGGISAALLRHNRPSAILRTLIPVAAPAYTGIIIIASESLPVHGMKGATLPVPCLFPKIWDTNMNLIFERNMLEVTNAAMIRYAPVRSIFTDSPSGLSPEINAIVGDKPLRIFARGVFGINPTDPIIDSDDALLIISSEENRRLLREGRVVIVLDDSVLRSALSE
ncbi:hypothetical protein AGMMS50293_24750 [Spirochaetia bacterium]|nr:hypothetical protein AGMMS50293_24750 [Spirochaetia bacterium]